jgi:hypothetical protein
MTSSLTATKAKNRVSHCGKQEIFSFQSLVLEKISNFVLRLEEGTGSFGEQPASNKAAPTLKAVNVEGRL